MFLCDPRTTHIKNKGSSCHPLLLATEEGRSCSIHTESEGVNQASHGQKKESRRTTDRNMQREMGSGKERTLGIQGIWGFKVFVLRLHWGLYSPSSSESFLLTASQNEQLAFSNRDRVEPRGDGSLAPGRVVHKLSIQAWTSGPLITKGWIPSVETWMNS